MYVQAWLSEGGMIRDGQWAHVEGVPGIWGQAARSKGLAGSSQDGPGLGYLMGLTRASSEQEGAKAWILCACPTSGLGTRAAVSLEDC